MIKILFKNNEEYYDIKFEGHTKSDICASVSSIMYTTVNAIALYSRESIDYTDNEIEDYVKMIIHKDDEMIELLVTNMFNMLQDLIEDGNEDKIQIVRS